MKIQEKKCEKCGIRKCLNEFGVDRLRKNGLSLYCKECNNNRVSEYRKTKRGVLAVIYNNQKCNSEHRGHNIPTYSLNEFREFAYLNRKFHILFSNWENSGFKKPLSPSFDRINDYKGYTFDNCRWMTWQENNSKGCADRKNGINNKASKAVIQFNLDGEFVAEYYSIMQAERETKINQSNINQVCLGGRYTAGSYIWQYKY